MVVEDFKAPDTPMFPDATATNVQDFIKQSEKQVNQSEAEEHTESQLNTPISSRRKSVRRSKEQIEEKA